MEEWLQFEVAPLHFITLLVRSKIAIVMLGESEFTQHAHVTLALLLLLLGHSCSLGTLECILPLPVMIILSAESFKIAALCIFVSDKHEERAYISYS